MGINDGDSDSALDDVGDSDSESVGAVVGINDGINDGDSDGPLDDVGNSESVGTLVGIDVKLSQ